MNRTEQIRVKSFEEEEWQKIFYKQQQQYIKKRLEAIKYLHEGKTRKEVMDKVGCARQSLITWIDSTSFFVILREVFPSKLKGTA